MIATCPCGSGWKLRCIGESVPEKYSRSKGALQTIRRATSELVFVGDHRRGASSGDSVLILQETASGSGQTLRCGGADAVGDAERLLPAMQGEAVPAYTLG
jgi:hypothetical protein